MPKKFNKLEMKVARWIVNERQGLTAAQIAKRDTFLNGTPGARAIYDALRRTEATIDRAMPRLRKRVMH